MTSLSRVDFITSQLKTFTMLIHAQLNHLLPQIVKVLNEQGFAVAQLVYPLGANYAFLLIFVLYSGLRACRHFIMFSLITLVIECLLFYIDTFGGNEYG